MFKMLISLSFAFTLVVILSTPVFSQEGSKQEGMEKSTKADKGSMDKGTKEARWEGVVVRSSKDKKTLTVRKVGSSVEKTVAYDDSTQWVSQEHGSKKVNKIDADDVKDGDRVIVKGTDEAPGRIHATLISKRLTPLH